MQPLPRPSVSPLPSWASRPGIPRSAPFIEIIRDVLRWWFQLHKPTPRERFLEQRAIEKLAAELEDAERGEH